MRNYLKDFTKALSFFAFTVSGQGANANQISDKLKSQLLKGYMITCVPTLEKQAPWIARTKLEAYCSCVGGKTFQNLTERQYEFLNRNSRLPPEIEAQRNAFRNQCDSQLE